MNVIRGIRNSISTWKLIRAARVSPLKIIIGAARSRQAGWIPTDIQYLNILRVDDWEKYFSESSIDAMLAEHVWEHFTEDEAQLAARNCHRYLKANGYLRIAVPDGFHPSPAYRELVMPGGTGGGAEDHKVLYNYRTLSDVFRSEGFRVELLEWFDEKGIFHFKEWSDETGLILRSCKHDNRNKNGELLYTSIILDAWKQ